MSSRPLRAIIDLGALRNNVALTKQMSGEARAFGVVKADGYGHGLRRIYPGLSGLDGLAVLEIASAIELRELGDQRPILLLEGVFGSAELKLALEHQLSVVVYSMEQVDLLLQSRETKRIDVFVKVNTGMNRLGLSLIELPQVCRLLAEAPIVSAVTVMTHYADADGERGIDWQDKQLLSVNGIRDFDQSRSNSAALIRFGAKGQSWVRPGMMLYGVSPIEGMTAQSIGLKPVMTLVSKIIAIQQLDAGDRVGYGGAFTASHSMRIGIVAGGYGDGYPRSATHRTPVLVSGKKVSVIGRVSMDTVAIDLTHAPQSQVGSPVTLWGEGLPVEDVARSAGTIGYELVTRLNARVPVEIIGE
jgi:alanine racemase